MKVTYVLAASLLLSLSAYAQKDEIKGLKKLYEIEADKLTAEQKTKYKDLLVALEGKLGSATDEQKADYYFYKADVEGGEVMTNPAKMADPKIVYATLDSNIEDLHKAIELEKKGKPVHTKEIQEEVLPGLKMAALQLADVLTKQKMYKEAAPFFNLAYKADTKDANSLYNAAAMAVNGQDYDNALKYYLELDKLGFTGEGTTYVAKSKTSGQLENFPNRATMDIAVKQGLYIDPKEEKTPSVKGDIVKNIALIYSQKGEVEKAKEAMSNARKANPNDTGLIIAEAELYLKTKDMAKYKELITEAAAKNPNDAVLFYNLGVVTTEADPAGAEAYYKKSLAINPDYFDALIGIGALQLRGEKQIVDEMNKLGTTAKDNQRYEVLKKKKDGLYTTALPYFEKAHKVKPEDQDAIAALAGLYQALDRTADYKAMKAKQKAN